MASAAFALVLWLVKLLELVLGFDAVGFGVYPRRLEGLAGILTSPFVHASFTHLASNTFASLTLGTALLYGYPKAARIVIPVLLLATGLGVWLFGRESYHIGASGLTFGVMFFVFTVGVLRWDRQAIGLSLVVFFLYGGMVWGLIPEDARISYESHLSGAISGAVLAFLLRRADPPPPRTRYSWELEAQEQSEHPPDTSTRNAPKGPAAPDP
jgi:membrane associated rhomboid family serine protease